MPIHSEANDAAAGRRCAIASWARRSPCSWQRGYAGHQHAGDRDARKVSKRDLYSLFRSKQAMLSACIAERAERMRVPLHLPPPRSRAALTATLATFGTTLIGEISRPEVLATYRLAILEADRAPDVARTLDREGRAGTMAALAELLRAAQVAGLLGPGDPDAMAEQFIALLWGGLLVRLLLKVADPPDAREAERRARVATEALLRLHPAANRHGRA